MLKIPRLVSCLLIAFLLAHVDIRITQGMGENEPYTYFTSQVMEAKEKFHYFLDQTKKSADMLKTLLIRPQMSTLHKRIH